MGLIFFMKTMYFVITCCGLAFFVRPEIWLVLAVLRSIYCILFVASNVVNLSGGFPKICISDPSYAMICLTFSQDLISLLCFTYRKKACGRVLSTFLYRGAHVTIDLQQICKSFFLYSYKNTTIV